jgi:hypothetical protein
MSKQRLSAMGFFFAAAVFFFVGVRAEPRHMGLTVLGIVFLVLGIGALRRTRR